MTPAEVAAVLVKASAYDLRTVGEADVLAWHEVLADYEFTDALTAVALHYAEHTDRLMPAHVRRLATALERARRRTARETREQLALDAAAAAPRTDHGDDVRDAVRAILPPGDPDKLRWGHGHWRQVQQDAARQRTAQPNPMFDPTALTRLAELTPPGPNVDAPNGAAP